MASLVLVFCVLSLSTLVFSMSNSFNYLAWKPEFDMILSCLLPPIITLNKQIWPWDYTFKIYVILICPLILSPCSLLTS